MATGEGEGVGGQADRKLIVRLRAARGRPQCRRREAVRDDGAAILGAPPALHGALHAAEDLDGMHPGSEETGARPLEEALDKALDGRQRSHPGEPTRGPAVGGRSTAGCRGRYLLPGGGRRDVGYTRCPSNGRPPSTGDHRPGAHDRDSHRVVLRAVRHALHLRVRRPATASAGTDAGPRQRPEELRHVRQHVARRGDGRGPLGRRAGGHDPAAGRVPPDVQLLHVVPPVHVRQLLERRRGALPVVRAAGRSPRCRTRRSPSIDAERLLRAMAPEAPAAPHGEPELVGWPKLPPRTPRPVSAETEAPERRRRGAGAASPMWPVRRGPVEPASEPAETGTGPRGRGRAAVEPAEPRRARRGRSSRKPVLEAAVPDGRGAEAAVLGLEPEAAEPSQMAAEPEKRARRDGRPRQPSSPPQAGIIGLEPGESLDDAGAGLEAPMPEAEPARRSSRRHQSPIRPRSNRAARGRVARRAPSRSPGGCLLQRCRAPPVARPRRPPAARQAPQWPTGPALADRRPGQPPVPATPPRRGPAHGAHGAAGHGGDVGGLEPRRRPAAPGCVDPVGRGRPAVRELRHLACRPEPASAAAAGRPRTADRPRRPATGTAPTVGR